MPLTEAIPSEVPVGKRAGSNSLIQVASNADIRIAEQAAARALTVGQQEAPLPELISYLQKAWEAARRAKQHNIQDRLYESLRQRRGEYDPDKLQAIQAQGGSAVYMLVTDTKCTAAASWIRDIVFPNEDKPWALKPTPNPELQPEHELEIKNHVAMEAMMAAEGGMAPGAVDIAMRVDALRDAVRRELYYEAEMMAARAEQVVDDQLWEGGWYKALDEVIEDIVTFDCAFMVGPEFHEKMELDWATDDMGNYTPVRVKKIKPHWYRWSPFDVYPAPDARDVDDGYLFLRQDMRRSQLRSYRNIEGFNKEAIDAVLLELGMNGLKDWLWDKQTRADYEDRSLERDSPDKTIEVLRFFGSVPGKLLRDWGMDASRVVDLTCEYEVEAWLIGKWCIRTVMNKDPLFRRPVYKASFENVPGSFWGKGPPRKMRDCQVVCNAAARSIVNNMGIASGPQVEIFEDRLAEGEEIEQMYPWRIWQTKSDPTGGGHRAIDFHDVPMVAEKLMGIYSFFLAQAEDQTGIPAYVHGNANVGGGGRTASGLSMLMSSASKGIKQVIGNLDRGIIERTIERLYQWDMERHPDPTIKGDLEIVARGSSALLAKEQLQVRRNEALVATNNPIDYGLMGPNGRSILLRETLRTLDLPVDQMVPDPMRQRALMFANMAAAAQQGAISEGGEGGANMGTPPGSGTPPPGARTLNDAGAPVSGQDTTAFENRRR